MITPNPDRYDPASNAFRPAPGSACAAKGTYAGLPGESVTVYLPAVVK